LKIIIPKSNLQDVYLKKELKGKLQIYTVENIADVLKYVLKESAKKKSLLTAMKKQFS